MVRTIQAPGIELNEIDRSGYDQTVDNSIVGTTSLLMGFADVGQDYTIQNINSITTFVNQYGKPTNEAERYFYNGAYEILNRGGRLYTAKLPYDNNSLDKFPYTTYQVGDTCIPLSSPYDVMTSNKASTKIGSISVSLYDFLLMPNVDFKDLLLILIDNGIVSEDTTDMTLLDEFVEQQYIITEDEYTVGGRKVDFCTYYTESGISLSIICDIMDYFKGVANVDYYTYDVIDNVFKETNQTSALYGKYKNNSVYMVRDMMTDKDKFKDTYLSDYPSQTREDYSRQIDSIYEKLTDAGTFEELTGYFGKTKNLQYYREYFYSLSAEVSAHGIREDKQKSIYNDLMYVFNAYDNKDYLYAKYTDIKKTDNNITSYIEISSMSQTKKNSGMIDIDTLDKLIIDDQNVDVNKIMIVDVSRKRYSKDTYHGDNFQYVGILPVITTAANAMAYQNVMDCSKYDTSCFITLNSIQNTYSDISSNMISGLNNEYATVKEKNVVGFTQNLGSENNVSDSEQTVSRQTDQYFPQIKSNSNGVEFEHLKKIGVVVFSMYVDHSNDGKISFIPVESFVGSLNNRKIDQNTNQQIFIDNIINNNSKYIRFFSNVPYREDGSKPETQADRAEIFIMKNQSATSLGLYESDCDKKISVNRSINSSIDRILESLKDPNRYRIDTVVDGGVSNISQFIDSIYRNKGRIGYYDISNYKTHEFYLNDNNTKQWLNVLNKYDKFCKYVRKDCIFIADGLRTLCLNGNEKRVRNTRPENTIENTVLKDIKYMSGQINSSYGAGYCDWFMCVEHSTGDKFWCPPSIKAAGIYTYTDAYSNFWMAPAGLSRGRLPQDVLDCAFSPTIDQAGVIYNNNWNYSVNYPIEGIVMEGQRTFQKNKTAMDRVNVRRLCLGIEKTVGYISKFYNYEQNTNWLRMRFKDQISNYLQQVKDKDGISDYVVICDDRNNTTQTIENNELHLTVAVKPIKAVEFIICQFVCTNQSANVVEVAESEM